MGHHAVAAVAALLGEPSRAAIVLALLDGRALPAGELAKQAKLSAPATSLHLAKLVQGGLLVVHQEGRHRYFRLATAYAITDEGARWLRDALCIDPSALASSRRAPARRCLDWTERRPHVAGALGAAMLARFFEERWIARLAGSRALRVTERGREGFAKLGVRA